MVAQVQGSGGWGRRIAPSSRPVCATEFQGGLGSRVTPCFKRKEKNTFGGEKYSGGELLLHCCP